MWYTNWDTGSCTTFHIPKKARDNALSVLLSPFREFFRKGDLLLLSLCLIASGFGLVLIYTATRWTGSNSFIIVQTIAICIGVMVYIVLTLVDFQLFTEKCWRYILGFNVLFILTVLTPLGYSAGGNLNWIQLAKGLPLIQPNEIVKIPFILLSAFLIVRIQENRVGISSLTSVSLQAGHAFFMIALIAIVCGDLGTCMVYLFIFIIMSFVSGIKLRWFVCTGLLLLITVTILWIFILPETSLWKDYRIVRFRVLFDHDLDPQGIGFHQMRSLLALGSGQIFGQGFLHGTQTQALYSSALPARHTDFIFSVAGEEFGLLGCLLLLLILSLIILRCVWISRHASSPFSAYTVMGMAGMLLTQIFFNVGMCLFVLPVMGLTLPFISYGGSSIITLFAAMGIVSSVRARTLPSWLRDRSQV